MIDKIIKLGFNDVFSSVPSQYVTIKDAIEGNTRIKLNNGFYHEFNKDELIDLSTKIPLYLWSLVKIPFIFIKSIEVGEFFINGEEWNKRALSILLGREVSSVISTVDVEILLKQYRSLIFIFLSPSIYMDLQYNEM
ncbi:MAG: DUF61 family protein [Saccharolobus sp.]